MKYTHEEIKAKAVEFLSALEQNDVRCELLVMMLGTAFNLPAAECLRRIKQLAEGGEA